MKQRACAILSCMCLVGMFMLAACAPAHKLPTSTPRAAPGYVQWLERQSLLSMAPQFTHVVSGTETLLRMASVDAHAPAATQGFAQDRIATLLQVADTWLYIHPPTLLTTNMRPVWQELLHTTTILEALPLRALYIAPTGESGSVWNERATQYHDGEDVISYTFAPYMGEEKHFQILSAWAAQKQWQLGTSLLPLATGLGPDFFLAARAVRSYQGSYMMWELDADIVSPALAQDSLPFIVPGGWATTGEITGNDGRTRRWVYRCAHNPQRPVLWWDDPSGNAKRIVSASVIQQVGILQHTLAGVDILPLMGLDAENPQHTPATHTREPALSAMRDISREVRRYGGWSAQLGIVPPQDMQRILQEGADFIADGITTPFAEYALISGDAGLLRAAMTEAVNLPLEQRRVLRGNMQGCTIQGLNIRTLPVHERQHMQDIFAQQGYAELAPVKDATLYTTPTSLAALASGLSPYVIPSAAEDVKRVMQNHLLLLAFRAGLPGMLWISGHELTGSMNLPHTYGAPYGAWSLNPIASAHVSTRQGIPAAPMVYGSLAEQHMQPQSFVAQASHIIQARHKHGMAQGQVLGVLATHAVASIAVCIALPPVGTSRMMVLVANFGKTVVEENIPVPSYIRGTGQNILGHGDVAVHEQRLAVRLAPYSCRWILFGNTP